MKKNTLLLLAAAAAGVYFLTRRSSRPRGTVIVSESVPISEEEFNQRRTEAAGTPIEKITNVVRTLFPKRTAEERAQRRTARTTRKATRKTKRQKVAGFSDNVLY